MEIHNVNGGTNFFSEGKGKQIIYMADGKNEKSIINSFNSQLARYCTKEEYDAIMKVLFELEDGAGKNPQEIKKLDVSYWCDRIKTGLSCFASIATISKAPWWDPLAELIKNFIVGLK